MGRVVVKEEMGVISTIEKCQTKNVMLNKNTNEKNDDYKAEMAVAKWRNRTSRA